MNRVAKVTSIEDAIKEVKESYANSTQVVGWYSHPAEVRGPFNRWLTISEVPAKHIKDVGSQSDDAKYASAAMNYAPKLALEVERLQAELDQVKKHFAEITKLEYRPDLQKLRQMYQELSTAGQAFKQPIFGDSND